MKIKFIAAAFILALISDFSHAYPEIAQEAFHRDGVWVSRPNTLDSSINGIFEANHIQTVDAYAAWLSQNVFYKSDERNDDWSAPEDTLYRRFGDCEDFAFLNASVLKLFGFNPKILTFRMERGGHAICVFKERGQYSVFDNSNFKRTNTKSFFSFLTLLNQNYHIQNISEIDPVTKAAKPVLYF